MAAIHVAYAYERRNRCYRARGYVGDHRKPLHSIAVAIGESPDEALTECIEHIHKMHDRDGVTRPADIVRYGKVSGLTLDHLAF